MSRKKSSIFEQYLDKAVIAIAVIISLVIIFFNVLRAPAVKVDGRPRAPGEIDRYISTKADKLYEQIRGEPNRAGNFVPKCELFAENISKSIKGVDLSKTMSLPYYDEGTVSLEDRKYHLPDIPDVNDVHAAMVQIVTHIPDDPLNPNASFSQDTSDLNDIDLVSVQCTVDFEGIARKFRESFAAASVRKEWRDERYARPVFADVQLERREKLEDGQWSQWAPVPEARNFPLQKELAVPHSIDELKVNMDIVLISFGAEQYQKEILQPAVYNYAYPGTQWLCPKLWKTREELIAKQEEARKREQLEAEKRARIEERNRRTSARETRTTSIRGTGTGGAMPDMGMGGMGMPGMGMGGPGGMTPAAPTRQTGVRTQPAEQIRRTEPSVSKRTGQSDFDSTGIQKIENEFLSLKLDERNKLENLKKVVVWAYDDTTESGKEYQYRIRAGVFNPVAGKNYVVEEQQQLNSEVILWSKFSVPTEPIKTPLRMHLFPKEWRDPAKTATIEVMKYHLGRWSAKDFPVKCGEMIGKYVEETTTSDGASGYGSSEPQKIDYTTGAILVDVIKVNDWDASKGLKQQEYYSAVYSYNPQQLASLAIGERFWPSSVLQTYKDLQEKVKAAVEFRTPAGTPGRGFEIPKPGTMPGGMEGMPGMPGMMMPGMMPGM